jgi:hypothetical protein
VSIQPRYAAVGAAIVMLLVYAAMIASIRTAASDRTAAETRYLDATQLLAVPPVPLATLEADLAAAQSALARVETSASASSIDPASDEATASLIRRAQDAGLTVVAVARLDHSQLQASGFTYEVDAVRMGLHGSSQEAVIALLRGLAASDPALTPVLTSLTVEEGGVSAEIVFSVYSKIEPTPVAGAAGAAP